MTFPLPDVNRLFLAGEDGPLLLGVQLVRPRPLIFRGLWALQLDPSCAAARDSGYKEAAQEQEPPGDQQDLTGRTLMHA